MHALAINIAANTFADTRQLSRARGMGHDDAEMLSALSMYGGASWQLALLLVLISLSHRNDQLDVSVAGTLSTLTSRCCLPSFKACARFGHERARRSPLARPFTVAAR